MRPVLPSIQAPTLIFDRPGDTWIDSRHARYLADHVPGARLVELPGNDTLPFGPGQDELIDEVQEFLTGARHVPDPERILATVMFSDIVDSTRRAAEMGDRNWRGLLRSRRVLSGVECAENSSRHSQSCQEHYRQLHGMTIF